MIALVVSIVLWAIVATLALMLLRRGRALAGEGVRLGMIDFVRLMPRLAIGVIGAGFLAALLPQSLVNAWLGPGSGLIGISIATVAGALTPGGPVIGYAIGATALQAGAGTPQVVAYVTAWALMALQRVILWELPVMPRDAVWLRIAVSLPLPFAAALVAALLGKP